MDEILKENESVDDCPCKSVVRLAESTRGEFKLINFEMVQLKESFIEMRLEAKECLESVKETAFQLREGTKEFNNIQKTISNRDVENKKAHKKMWYAIAGCFCILMATGHASDIGKLIIKIMS
ncbi:MAG: hypothetical protein GQ540_03575 [Lutibacter sp.]|uniref:hypothetical protein n=1 Tax=Lutibacter sp. TaxID=1925666 RepID=UPI001A0CA8BD|nr:hypothetical protein [Lutibacter sp.]NOR27592.1 hypothetical protein [Lutibacter sp.]